MLRNKKNIFFINFLIFTLLFLFSLSKSYSQVFWSENFNNGCTSNCLANAYSGTNGAWSVSLTGVNGSDANLWYVSCAENGHTNGVCGTGCVASGLTSTLASLHVGASSASTGDIGADYDVGGSCGISTCPQTNSRAESPVINCTGQFNISLTFDYIEEGDSIFDDATLWYFDGSTWYLLSNTPKTSNAGCSGHGLWTSYTIPLPSSSNNNPNVQIGFNWTNNDDGLGTNPSFAVDNIELSSTTNQPPLANFFTGNTTICQGSCINFTDLSANTPTIWNWIFPGGTPNNANIQNPVNICYNTSGSFNVSLTVTNINGSNSYTKSLYINVNSLPVLQVSPKPATICTGGSILLSASGATTYTWFPLAGLSSTIGSSVSASPSITSSYTITGTTNGCTDTTKDTVYVIQPLIANAGTDDTICKGSSTTLNASGGTIYSWSPSVSLSCSNCQNPVANPLTTTTYTVSVSNGICPLSTDNVTIFVKPLPVPVIANNGPICSPITLNLTAAGGVSYLWTGPYGFTSTMQFPSISNTTTYNAGTYYVTVTDMFGCTGTTSTSVVIHPKPIVNAGSNSPICFGGKLLLTSGGGTTYLWKGPDGFISTIKNPIISSVTSLNSGLYSVTVTNSFSCTSTATTIVSILPKIKITTPLNLQLCPNILTNISPVVSGGIQPLNYYWNGYISSSAIVFSPQTDTIFSFHVIDANGCKSDTNFVTINVYPHVKLTLNTGFDSICPGSAAIINANVANGSLAPYMFYFQGGGILVPPVTVNPTVTTSYIISVKDDCGTIDTDTVLVKVSHVPSSFFTSDINYACAPAVVHFNQPAITSEYSYKWNFGDSGLNHISYLTNPVYVYYNSGTFDVSLTVSSPNGCSYTNTLYGIITVYQKSEAKFNAIPQVASILNPQIEFENLSSNAQRFLWNFGNGDTSDLVNPEIIFDSIGTFSVRLITESTYGCKDTAYGSVIVNDEFTFYAPNAFTPNNDGVNDTFYVKGNGINSTGFSMYIFDRWGELIYQTNQYDPLHPAKFGWDGKINFSNVGEPGVYVWYIIYKDIKNRTHKKTGIVTILN